MNNINPSAKPPNHGIAQLMYLVLLACLPGLCALVAFFGWGVLINVVWLSLCALVLEAALLRLRKQNVSLHLRDGSALLSALLLAMALPPTVPWWLGLCGIAFAIVVVKQLYGGLGHNLFNPAMAAYAMLLVSFPAPMTRWLLPAGVLENLPSFSDAITIFLGGEPVLGIDAYTGATWLDSFRQQTGAQLVSEFRAASPLAGSFAALGAEWVNVGFLLGGLWLLYRRVISWHIPLAFLGALSVCAALGWAGGSSASLGSPLMHLFSGATMLGAFFIATDPVTAATTPRGRLLYGALIGLLVFVIRAFSIYPDGVAFAVLLGNLAAPLIDAFTEARTFGPKT
ncbi:MAG: RnfABCDGE type electron transport complex subunit D [Pseudomonadales bacterium]|jgi:electron transport complex protein RnfD|nr:RnfABCDGE type electron transport complex subunit D [Pseudomonadales bacterium]